MTKKVMVHVAMLHTLRYISMQRACAIDLQTTQVAVARATHV